MSYIGYVIEELMHTRQAETERLAAGYRQRHAVRGGRPARRVRAASAGSTVRSASVPDGRQAGASATC